MCLSENKRSEIVLNSTTPCSGHGECLNGTCLCEIRFTGDVCDNFNNQYYTGTHKKNISWMTEKIFSRV